jgi:ATP-dependent 26S proteasome regulatory subunit
MTACISPNSPRMIEPNWNYLSSKEGKHTVIGDKLNIDKETMVPESHLSNNEVLQNPFELEVRSKRQKLSYEQTRFTDIIGHASVKLRIDELILPLGLPSTIADSVLKGIRSIPSSILLYGPPGCGKVSLLIEQYYGAANES